MLSVSYSSGPLPAMLPRSGRRHNSPASSLCADRRAVRQRDRCDDQLHQQTSADWTSFNCTAKRRPELCAADRRRVIKAFRVKDASSLEGMADYPVAAFLLDAWSPSAHGGTGQTFNWEIAARAAGCRSIILAGGLTPENVAEAVATGSPLCGRCLQRSGSLPEKKIKLNFFLFLKQ